MYSRRNSSFSCKSPETCWSIVSINLPIHSKNMYLHTNLSTDNSVNPVMISISNGFRFSTHEWPITLTIKLWCPSNPLHSLLQHIFKTNSIIWKVGLRNGAPMLCNLSLSKRQSLIRLDPCQNETFIHLRSSSFDS